VASWFLCLVLSLVLLGGSPHWALCIIAASACLALSAIPKESLVTSRLAWWALTLALVSLLQTLVLPNRWVEFLSPHAGEIWLSGLGPPTEGALPYSLTIDRIATSAEALKWATYAAVALCSAAISRIVGVWRGLALIYWLLVGLALLTLGHGLLNAETVLGLYRPSYNPHPLWALSPIVNPNNLASLLNLGTFLGIGLSFDGRISRQRWAMRAGLPPLVGVSLLSGSRAGVALLIFGTLIMVPVLRRLSRTPSRRIASFQWESLLLFALPVGGAVLAWFSASSGVLQKLLADDLSKLQIFKWSARLVDDFTLTGVGAGAFETGIQRYREMSGNYVWQHPENFVIGWVCDWGVLLGSCALLGLAWCLRPSQLARSKEPVTPYAAVGLAAVFLQNLVDVGFRTPAVMIMICSVAGSLWWTSKSQQHAPQLPRLFLQLRVFVGATLLAAFLSLCYWGFDALEDERTRIRQLVESTDFSSPKSAPAFFQRLRVAMARHPSDAYLALAGATGAVAYNQNDALRWTAEALKRDPKNSQTHLLLARQLYRRGALYQALLELRVVIELNPQNTHLAILQALAWTSNEVELLRIVPSKKQGAGTLLEIARLQVDASAVQRLKWLKLALERDPEQLEAKLRISSLLLDAVRHGSAPCEITSPCLDEVKRHLADPSVAKDHTPLMQAKVSIARAQMLSMQGQAEPALEEIAHRCPRYLHDCLYTWLHLAALQKKTPEQPRELLLDMECIDRKRCAATQRRIAQIYSSQRLDFQALQLLNDAAQQDPDAKSWSDVADLARRLGRTELEKSAREKAQSFTN
jgi:tetratricopeptide (TPR) repeat protein